MKKIIGYTVLIFSSGVTAAQTTPVWTKWLNRDMPSGTSDAEVLKEFLLEAPAAVCPEPLAIEARMVELPSRILTPGSVTPDKLRYFSAQIGLQCYNVDQTPPEGCKDYEVRFLCPPGTLPGVKRPEVTR